MNAPVLSFFHFTVYLEMLVVMNNCVLYLSKVILGTLWTIIFLVYEDQRLLKSMQTDGLMTSVNNSEQSDSANYPITCVYVIP